ncbi:MAG: 16S rRNA (cytosine(1402)-N(4))-methyltransferase RsmH [Bacteroidetes bacterium]|nr:16S rRNA (cytosine(1402)-N(4))-methyltransferase RsmH [Bacteroidota bacterium]MBL6943329.1 16S rRNA (cytosine(1402)-N(4))-methyltransferase RsmH [Bacteroidales bacterium]
MYHNPVLLHESIKGLNIIPNGNYVDVTFGGGGHSRAILQKIDNGRLIAFDQDSDALKNTISDDRFVLINHNFQFLKNFLRLHKVSKVNGILADLGVSSHQFDVPQRGFSTRFNAPLDMRMSTNQQKSAADIVNTYSENDLQQLFKDYGEIKNSKCVAKAIMETREFNNINTTAELINCIQKCFQKHKINKFLAQVFQALRIEVNDEMKALKILLGQADELLVPGGRLVVISYHSLEDRIVKNFIKSGNFKGAVEKDFYGNPIISFKSITRKPIVPNAKEIENNNRARSAKLRIAEKI